MGKLFNTEIQVLRKNINRLNIEILKLLNVKKSTISKIKKQIILVKYIHSIYDEELLCLIYKEILQINMEKMCKEYGK